MSSHSCLSVFLIKAFFSKNSHRWDLGSLLLEWHQTRHDFKETNIHFHNPNFYNMNLSTQLNLILYNHIILFEVISFRMSPLIT